MIIPRVFFQGIYCLLLAIAHFSPSESVPHRYIESLVFNTSDLSSFLAL